MFEKCKIRDGKIPIIRTNKIRYLLSEISSKFYKLKQKILLQSLAQMEKHQWRIYQIFKINNIPVASIGTLGIKYNNKIIKTKLTSPDTITIHKYLSFLKKKINNVIIETSSHGLDQKRLSY